MLQLQILSYSSLKKSSTTETFKSLLQDIPSVKALEYIVEKQNKVLYAFSDVQTQKELINEMRSYLNKPEQGAIDNFLIKNKNPVLIMNQSCLTFYVETLRMPYIGDKVLEKDDIRRIYLAYLLCSDIWSKHQETGFSMTPGSPEQMLLKVDMPLSEFKQHKDFKIALYKGTQFFSFCETKPEYKSILQAFLKERNISDWRLYLRNLLDAYCKTIPEKSIIYCDPPVCDFLIQYSISKEEWNNGIENANIDYLRDKFLIQISTCKYLVLNNNLIVDKMYQSMKFDFAQTASSNRFTINGREVKTIGDLNQDLGQVFSEEYFLYDLLDRIYGKTRSIIRFKGSDLLSQNIPAAPDYYMRDGKVIYLFEHKDVLLNEKHKQSTCVQTILDEIANKICQDSSGKKHRKGGGQLLHTVNGIVCNKTMDALDPMCHCATWIVPIVTVTDSAFSALGANTAVNKMFCQMAQQYDFQNSTNMKILPLTIIDIETLFTLSKRLHDGELNLHKLICEYQTLICDINGQLETASFSSFIKDNYSQDEFKADEVKFILGNFITELALLDEKTNDTYM